MRMFQPITQWEDRSSPVILIPVPGHNKQCACFHDITSELRKQLVLSTEKHQCSSWAPGRVLDEMRSGVLPLDPKSLILMDW